MTNPLFHALSLASRAYRTLALEASDLLFLEHNLQETHHAESCTASKTRKTAFKFPRTSPDLRSCTPSVSMSPVLDQHPALLVLHPRLSPLSPLTDNNNNITTGRTAPPLVCCPSRARSSTTPSTRAAPRAPRCAVPLPVLLHRLFAHAPLRSLDVTLPATSHITPALVLAFNCECECDCAGEEELRITHLTLRKPPPRVPLHPHHAHSPRRRRTDPASHTLTTTFPLPSSPASPPGTTASYTPPARRHAHTPLSSHSTQMQSQSVPALSPHPTDPLAQPDGELDLPTALAHLALLRTLRTPLPAAWAPALLPAAQNAGGKSAHPYPYQWTSERRRRCMDACWLAPSFALFWILPPHPPLALPHPTSRPDLSPLTYLRPSPRHACTYDPPCTQHSLALRMHMKSIL
ncbi:hypothetical protein C8J57DRAFT_1510414 [Mycena rebaudengoi]|nr:hypothetical protein C8J57DRAFT_1510414 [Mycena rebaudengoi]